MSCCFLFLPLQTAGDRLPLGKEKEPGKQCRKAFLFIYKKVHFSSSWDHILAQLAAGWRPSTVR